MTDLWQCEICQSMVMKEQMDGKCKICGVRTCQNCQRICERCQNICCMNHIESKIVMRQQRPFIHKLCKFCKEVW